MNSFNDLKKAIEKNELENKKNNEEKYDLIKKINTHEWKPVINKHVRKIDKSHVYVRYTCIKNKNILCVYIGKNIADLLNYKKGEHIGVLTSLTTPNLLLMVKNPEAIPSYTIHSTPKSENKHITFPIPDNFNFPKSQSLPVKFDLSQNYELIIDVSQIIKT